MDSFENFRNIVADLKTSMKQRMDKKISAAECRKLKTFQITELKNLNEKCQLAINDSNEKTEQAKQRLNKSRQGAHAVQYKINRLLKQTEEERSIQAAPVELISYNEFCQSAPSNLINKSKLSEHDKQLARLEFELIQRKQMNELLVKKQEELLRIKNEIIEKETNLTQIEPGIRTLLDSTKPLLAGLELDLENINKQLEFESFSNVDLCDSLMCLFRQCRNREAVELDVIAKFVRKDYFSVEFGSHLMEFTYDHNIGAVFVKSNVDLDHVGIMDFGRSRPNMFGQSDIDDPKMSTKISGM